MKECDKQNSQISSKLHMIYRMSQNPCHKLFLGILHPYLSKKVPINMGPKVNRFRDIDLRSYAGTRLSIT